MVCYEYEGDVYNKLFICNDVTHGGLCVIYKLLGADTRLFSMALDDWNEKFNLMPQ